MREIAQATKLETISMRIITFVALVYLPGTFISVGNAVQCKNLASAYCSPLDLDEHTHRHVRAGGIFEFPQAHRFCRAFTVC